jgi:hypothetical protein
MRLVPPIDSLHVLKGQDSFSCISGANPASPLNKIAKFLKDDAFTTSPATGTGMTRIQVQSMHVVFWDNPFTVQWRTSPQKQPVDRYTR